MFWLIRRIIRDFPGFERPVQLSIIAGVVLLVIAFVLFLVGSPEIRVPTLIGISALILVIQLSVLWGNRGMVTPTAAAQRAFLAEDFNSVLAILEPLAEANSADMRALTLLGNTYRQLGRLDESRKVLLEALDKAPDHHYPLYGFGRTLMVAGDYAEAIQALQKAIDAGAPGVVWVDLAEGHLRLGNQKSAASALEQALPAMKGGADAYRRLIAGYISFRLTGEWPPHTADAVDGLPYWRATAERYSQTPYGQAVAADLPDMEALALRHNE